MSFRNLCETRKHQPGFFSSDVFHQLAVLTTQSTEKAILENITTLPINQNGRFSVGKWIYVLKIDNGEDDSE